MPQPLQEPTRGGTPISKRKLSCCYQANHPPPCRLRYEPKCAGPTDCLQSCRPKRASEIQPYRLQIGPVSEPFTPRQDLDAITPALDHGRIIVLDVRSGGAQTMTWVFQDFLRCHLDGKSEKEKKQCHLLQTITTQNRFLLKAFDDLHVNSFGASYTFDV